MAKMTDRELLKALGYREMSAGFGEHILATKDGHFRAQEGWTSEAISYVLKNESFWMELDDALAAKGWDTDMRHRRDGFHYRANKPRFDVTPYEVAGGRLEAVRSVYEKIMELEHGKANSDT